MDNHININTYMGNSSFRRLHIEDSNSPQKIETIMEPHDCYFHTSTSDLLKKITILLSLPYATNNIPKKEEYCCKEYELNTASIIYLCQSIKKSIDLLSLTIEIQDEKLKNHDLESDAVLSHLKRVSQSKTYILNMIVDLERRVKENSEYKTDNYQSLFDSFIQTKFRAILDKINSNFINSTYTS